MSTKDPNLKVIFGADTKDFDKGAKQVKQGIKDLDKSTTSMLSSIGNAFGVDTKKVEQMTSAMKGLGQKMSECGSAGVAAFGNILKAVGPIGGAIAGIGIGAAIAGFKQLKAEADNFKATIDGMNMAMATSAYISTYKQVLHDVNSETGKRVAESMNEWEKGFGRFKAQLGATFTTFMSSKTLGQFGQSMKELKQSFKDADEAAERNAQRASQIADIRKEELQVRKDIADIDVVIAEQRRIIRDRSKSAEERSAAEAEVRDKIAQKSALQTSMAERLYNLQKDMTSEAGSTYDQMKEVTDLYVQWKGLSASEADQLATIDRYSNSIATSTSKAAASTQKQREEIQKMLEYMAKRTDMGLTQEGLFSGAPTLQGGAEGPSMSILLHPKLDEKEVIDISKELTSLVEQATMSVSESIGSLIGDLVTGGNAWTNFANNALSAFGDMAIAVGKMAIGTGVATLGIKKSLESLNGYVAIAAGAALVALGTAVKSGLSNIASGDYSAGGGGYSGSYATSSSGDWEQREVNVNVTGTLVADGDQLVTVINNTNKKNYYLQ